MSLSLWSDALLLMTQTLSAVFGYIVQIMGAALPTFIHLAFLLAFTRLIIRPLVGIAISDVLTNGIQRRGQKSEQKKAEKAQQSKK